MIILALETATEACSAALLCDGEVLERYRVVPRGHTRLILPMLDELLAEASVSLTQVDALAFGRGPGAFTGVRIAVGVVQGIAFGADLPVVPVSTLAALAQGAAAGRVLAAIDARMGEVYWGAFERNSAGLMVVSREECLALPAQVPRPMNDGWHGAGSGWQAHGEVLVAHLGGVVATLDGGALPHAGDVARLGAAGLVAGQVVSAEVALPVYLRDQVAWQKNR
jgi:tRNA threonylcarbamoyladenosine biosynthesis protein TsaB